MWQCFELHTSPGVVQDPQSAVCPPLVCEANSCSTIGNGCSSMDCGVCQEDELCVLGKCQCSVPLCGNVTCGNVMNSCNNTAYCGPSCNESLTNQIPNTDYIIIGVVLVFLLLVCAVILVVFLVFQKHKRNRPMDLNTIELSPIGSESTLYARIPPKILNDYGWKKI